MWKWWFHIVSAILETWPRPYICTWGWCVAATIWAGCKSTCWFKGRTPESCQSRCCCCCCCFWLGIGWRIRPAGVTLFTWWGFLGKEETLPFLPPKQPAWSEKAEVTAFLSTCLHLREQKLGSLFRSSAKCNGCNHNTSFPIFRVVFRNDTPASLITSHLCC